VAGGGVTGAGERIVVGAPVTVSGVRVGAVVRLAAPTAGPVAPVLVPSGGSGGPESDVHTQTTPATVWTIDHNLGFRPGGVTVEETDGTEIRWSDRDDPTVNRTVLTFLVPVAGRAYLS
jgi:hypothetical protein